MFDQLINTPISTVVMTTGFILVLIGIWGMLTRRNLLTIIIGFTLVDTGIHMIMVAVGYMSGKTAPIINAAVSTDMSLANKGLEAVNKVVDPIPSALVLTAIVIGLGVTALMLSYAVNIYKTKETILIDDCAELKW